MADIVDKATRSRMMSGIKGKNTKPEVMIRKGLFSKGFRYRLHRKDLPGKPDLVLPRFNAVIFVNGCFWHAHGCHLFKWPSTNKVFWKKKISGNKKADLGNIRLLKKLGWRVFTVWECGIKGKKKRPKQQVIDKTSKWLWSNSGNGEIKGVN